MGGAASVDLTPDGPGRVAGLALPVPGVTGYDGMDETEPCLAVERPAKAGDMEGIARLGMGMRGRAGGGTPESAPVVAAHFRAVLPAWFAHVGHRRTDPPAFDRLGEIAVPTAPALGELDRPEVVRRNEEMAARIPGCRLARLPARPTAGSPDCRLARLAAWPPGHLATCDHSPQLREPETATRLIEEPYAEAAA
ncbi:hypothetical protein [Streptomyces sp. NPDC013740]|uniref:hypothetical protein n=1 Tax=Streptomyces sp. NPDC013740 TaxID=3364867 RepID=UPI0036F9F77A